MKYLTLLLAQVLLTAFCLATPRFPRGSGLARRIARREGLHEGISQRQSRPRSHFEEAIIERSNISHISYDDNWAGVVIDSPPSGESFWSVTATFVVPTPAAAGSEATYAASAWVGIDGDTYADAILQTGVDFYVKSGTVSYKAWYEWLPADAHDFSLSISAGDTITMTVTATSSKAGTAVVENVTTGLSVSKSLTSSTALEQVNAEWIVEDFEVDGSLIPFADFGKVSMKKCVATSDSSSLGPTDGIIVSIKQSGTVLTTISRTSSTVTVTYAG